MADLKVPAQPWDKKHKCIFAISDNCLGGTYEVVPKEFMVGNCCRPCINKKNQNYYAQNKERLIEKAKLRSKLNYVKKIPKTKTIDELILEAENKKANE